MYIDQYLSWSVHIDKLCKKVASDIGTLERIRPFVNSNTLQMIFSSLIQPYFDYCLDTLVGKIQKLQNRAARVLTSANYDVSTDIPLEKLGWKDLQSQQKIAKGTIWCIKP